MPRGRFEPTISTSKLPQTYALDCAATGTEVGLVLRNGNAKKNKAMLNQKLFFFTPTIKLH